MFKHYHLKRFFYRFFRMQSPRSGAIAGLAWLILIWELFPVYIWKIVPILSGKNIFLILSAMILPPAVLWLYGMLTYAHNLYLLQRKHFAKKKIFRLPAFFATLFFPVSGILSAILLCKLKHWLFLPAAVGSIIIFIIPFFDFITMPLTISALSLGSLILLLISLAGITDRKKFRSASLLPLGLLILYFAGISIWYFSLSFTVENQKNILAGLIGHEVTPESFYLRNRKGIPIEAEPFKTFLKTYPKQLTTEFSEIKDSASAKKRWEKYRQENKAFINAAEKLLELHPQPVKYQQEGGNLAGLLMPNLSPIREAARFYALELRAFPSEKQRVISCNQNIMNLRDWALYNETLIGKLVALSIELSRLSALSETFFKREWTGQEMQVLIGKPIDWDQQFINSFGMESAMFESCIDQFERFNAMELHDAPSGDAINGIIIGYRFLPLFTKIHALADFSNAQKWYLKICRAVQDKKEPAAEKMKKLVFDTEKNKRNSYYFSCMLCPALQKAMFLFTLAQDHLQMAELSTEIAEYYYKHQALPDDLKFLPERPRTLWTHHPFQYEKTPDGFQIYFLDDKGKRSKDERYYYKVNVWK